MNTTYFDLRNPLNPKPQILIPNFQVADVWRSGFMLGIEILGSTTVVLYGFNLILDPLYEDFVEDIRLPGTPKVKARSF